MEGVRKLAVNSSVVLRLFCGGGHSDTRDGALSNINCSLKMYILNRFGDSLIHPFQFHEVCVN